MSTWIALAEYRTVLREVADPDLDSVLQLHLDSAEGEVAAFIGYDPLIEYETPAEVPAELKTAAYLLAQLQTDQLPSDVAQQRRDAAERLMRPFRIETGLAA